MLTKCVIAFNFRAASVCEMVLICCFLNLSKFLFVRYLLCSRFKTDKLSLITQSCCLGASLLNAHLYRFIESRRFPEFSISKLKFQVPLWFLKNFLAIWHTPKIWLITHGTHVEPAPFSSHSFHTADAQRDAIFCSHLTLRFAFVPEYGAHFCANS